MLNRSTVYLLSLILLLSIGLRAVNLFQPIQGDEPAWVIPAVSLMKYGTLYDLQLPYMEYGTESEFHVGELYTLWSIHPPLGVIIYAASHAVLSMSKFPFEASFRIVPFILGILTIYLTYLLGKEIFNNNIGMLAAFLESISTYHIFHSSLRIDIDGGIITFLILLIFLFYLRWLKTSKNEEFLGVLFLMGLFILTKLSAILMFLFLGFYELLHRRLKHAFLVITIPLLIFSMLALADKFITDNAYINGVLNHGLPAILSPTTSKSLWGYMYSIGYNLGMILEPLTMPMFVLLLLSILHYAYYTLSKKQSIANTLLRTDFFIILWIILVFFTSVRASGDPQRYFTVALPFVFLIVAEFITKFRLNKFYISFSGLIFLILSYHVNINDYQFYAYLLYHNNISTIVVWFLPLLLLFLYIRWKSAVVSILIGAYIGASIYFILFPINTWPIAVSRTYNYASDLNDSNLIVSKSSYVLRTVMFYDWYSDGRIDKDYMILPSVDKIKEFEKSNLCNKMTIGGYPLIFVCKS